MRVRGALIVVALSLTSTGCDEGVAGVVGAAPTSAVSRFCNIPQSEIRNVTSKDAIPALTDPTFLALGGWETGYLEDSDRVIGVFDGTEPLAIPLNIMWYHEIVNIQLNGFPVTVSHCPLTGSSMGFDRREVRGAEFGVSGLLFRSNLIMYDRASPESLWPQMARGATCGDRTGASLEMVPVVEMTWKGWRTLHPETRVLSGDTGWRRSYDLYPYGRYDEPQNTLIFHALDLDPRRPPKERALGIPFASGGVAFPFGRLDEVGPMAAVHDSHEGQPLVVFWDRSVEGAMAFRPELDGQPLTFSAIQGKIVDEETGSVWQVDGFATEGPLAGSRLTGIPEAFVAFWFAWPEFYPDIRIWSGS